jgi:hypothetical protein
VHLQVIMKVLEALFTSLNVHLFIGSDIFWFQWLNVAVRRFLVHISARRPAILPEVFVAFLSTSRKITG